MEDQDASTLTRLDTQSCGILNRTRNAGSWPGRAHWLNRFLCGRNRKQSSLGRPAQHARHFATGPVAYAISVVAIVALGATLAFASGEMGETMKRLLQIGIAVCLVVFAAQVMSSFIARPRRSQCFSQFMLSLSLRFTSLRGDNRDQGQRDGSHGLAPLPEDEMASLDFDGPEQTIMRTSLSRPQQLLGGDESCHHGRPRHGDDGDRPS